MTTIYLCHRSNSPRRTPKENLSSTAAFGPMFSGKPNSPAGIDISGGCVHFDETKCELPVTAEHESPGGKTFGVGRLEVGQSEAGATCAAKCSGAASAPS